MRELEREPASDTAAPLHLAIIGRGRLGTALVEALQVGRGAAAAVRVIGPVGRDHAARMASEGARPAAVLLCVPDREIAAAAAALAPGPLVGHCSGAVGLEALAPHEAFALHPLMTVTPGGARFAGAGAAIDGSTPRAVALAQRLATALELRPVRVAAEDRAAYHAAASMASNFLITLEAAAEELAATAGVSRELLVPLVRASVENWGRLGVEQALTGPVARGDEGTVASQRAAVAERAPSLLPMFDALVTATRRLAGRPGPEAAA